MDLSIIIVSWKVKERLKENLKALFQSNGKFSFEVFVVDNNSNDGSAEMVKENFSQVRLIENQENLGFAKANNQAIKESKGNYILLLNPDMRIFPDTLKNMLKWAINHQQSGVSGCQLINAQGGILPHVRRFPTLIDQLAIILKIPHLIPSCLNSYLKNDFNYTEEASVDSIRGAFFLIKREVIRKLGGLDERYFIWFEEVDYCRQVKNAGWEVMYTPKAQCLDYVGQSFNQVKRSQTQKYFKDSMLKYFKKWHPAWQVWILQSAWLIGGLINLIGENLNLKSKAKT